jgi:hypothetical protein
MPVRNIKTTMVKVRNQVVKIATTGVLATVQTLKEELVLATPVDTGRARASWSINKVRGDKEPTFEITNDAPYIGKLNDGYSDQAPAHFIESIALKYGRVVGQVVTYKDE